MCCKLRKTDFTETKKKSCKLLRLQLQPAEQSHCGFISRRFKSGVGNNSFLALWVELPSPMTDAQSLLFLFFIVQKLFSTSSDTAIRWPRLLCCTYKIPDVAFCAAGNNIVNIFRVSRARPVQAVLKGVSGPFLRILRGSPRGCYIFHCSRNMEESFYAKNMFGLLLKVSRTTTPFLRPSRLFPDFQGEKKVPTFSCLSADVAREHRAHDSNVLSVWTFQMTVQRQRGTPVDEISCHTSGLERAKRQLS